MSQAEHYRRFNHIKPTILWQYIDEGLYSLLDEDEEALENGSDDEYQNIDTFSHIERKIACEKLSEREFCDVRKDIMKMVKEGRL